MIQITNMILAENYSSRLFLRICCDWIEPSANILFAVSD